jgi:glucose uptake protein GlcU
MENYQNYVSIIFGVVGVITSVIGIIFAAWHRSFLSQEEERRKSIDFQFAALWRRYDEMGESTSSVQKQLDTLQGEHNVIALNRQGETNSRICNRKRRRNVT